MNREELQKKFNTLFSKHISMTGAYINPQLRSFQPQLFDFFVEGYELSKETESGVIVEGQASSVQKNGKVFTYNVSTEKSVKVDDVIGVLIKGKEETVEQLNESTES